MTAALDLHDIAKTFGRGRKRVDALRGVSLAVEPGQIFGLLGPNGAGKSTLVKVLLTVIRPKHCNGTMLGERIGHRGTLARVGYLPEHHRFPAYQTGWQALEYAGAMAGVPRRERRKRAHELLELTRMTDWAKHRVRGYSKGMRQRLGLAQALVNNPELVFLDEPTDGVDPVGRREIREALLELRSQGKTLMINSHLLSELEQTCDRVAIMLKGQIAREGTLDELASGQTCYRVELATPPDESLLEIARKAAGPSDAPGVRIEDHTLLLPTLNPAPAQAVLRSAVERGLTVTELRPFRPSLEDLFIETVSEDSGPGGTQGKAEAGGAR
ncbi:MAG: ABC transporter ATP-binding protein [Planctomycetota bacterium]